VCAWGGEEKEERTLNITPTCRSFAAASSPLKGEEERGQGLNFLSSEGDAYTIFLAP